MNLYHSDVDVHKFEFLWAINTYKVWKDVNIRSPSFSAGDKYGSRWHIRYSYKKNPSSGDIDVSLVTVLDSTPMHEGFILASQVFYFSSKQRKIKLFNIPANMFTSHTNQHTVYLNAQSKDLVKIFFSELSTDYEPMPKFHIICELSVINKAYMCDAEETTGMYLQTYNKLPNNLIKIFETGDFADVTFLLGDEKIKAHRNILAASSPVFNAMFPRDTSGTNILLEITHIKEDVFRQMLCYIYTHEIENIEVSMDLLKAADAFQLEELKTICCEIIRKKLMNTSNVADILIHAYHCNSTALVKYATVYINKYIENVRDTPGYKHLKKNYPQLIIMLYEQLITSK